MRPAQTARRDRDNDDRSREHVADIAVDVHLRQSVAENAKDEDAGVTIKNVIPDSSAAKAGLKTGDRLLTIDGRWTDSIADTYRAASYAKPGMAAPVVVKRDGKELKFSVTPANGL